MSLAQLYGILRGSLWSILLMMLIAGAVAFGFSSSLPKEYQAKARVLLNLANSDPTQYSALKKNTEASYIGTQIKLIGDTSVTSNVVEKLGWANDPNVISAWQAATGGRGDIIKWAAARIAGNMAARQLEDSAVIEIYYSAGSPDAAKQVAGLLRAAYIETSQKVRQEAARRASAWNRTQAAKALIDLQRAEAKRIAFMKANGIPIDANGGLEVQEINKLRHDSAVAPMPKAIMPSLVMTSIRSQLNQLDTEIAQRLQIRGPEDPDYRAAVARRDVLQAQLARETAFNQSTSTATQSMIDENHRMVSNQYLEARLRILDRAPLYDQLAQINRDVALRTTLYQAAALRVSNFDMVADAPTDMIVLGDVIGSDDPSFPNVPLSTGLAAGFAGGLGIALALFGEMFRRRIRGAEDLQFYSRVPVLAVIAAGPAAPGKSRWWNFRQVWRLQPA